MTVPPPAEIRRIVYMGTPEVAVPPLVALHGAGFDLGLVITRPERRRSRGGAPRPSPVGEAAGELGLRISTDLDDVAGVAADLVVVVAFGRIIPATLLDRVAMVNMHFSLLPRWRGAAPVERAILAGDTRTGVCLMEVVEELDAGGVYRRAVVPISPEDTLSTLRRRLVAVGTEQLLGALDEGLGAPVPQTGAPVYAHKIRPEELRLDWSRPAGELHRLVRLGGAWTTLGGRRLKIHEARVVDDAGVGPGSIVGTIVGAGDGRGLELCLVQPEGRARVDAASWRNGARLGPDDRLGE
ncbi:MAG: methionyl-tRNA formyltransferase [Acidimicrobiales bacterium]